jgi:hypothetical protein
VCDFLSSLMDNAKEWRVLLSYLKTLEEHPAAIAENQRFAAQAAQYGGEGSSFLQSMQWLQKQAGASKRHMQRRLLEDVTLTAADKASLITAEFDPMLHAGLIENLKKLYVCVTRAKSNVSVLAGLYQLRFGGTAAACVGIVLCRLFFLVQRCCCTHCTDIASSVPAGVWAGLVVS